MENLIPKESRTYIPSDDDSVQIIESLDNTFDSVRIIQYSCTFRNKECTLVGVKTVFTYIFNFIIYFSCLIFSWCNLYNIDRRHSFKIYLHSSSQVGKSFLIFLLVFSCIFFSHRYLI